MDAAETVPLLRTAPVRGLPQEVREQQVQQEAEDEAERLRMTQQQLREDFQRRRAEMDAAETAPVLRRPYMVQRPPNEEFQRRRAAMDAAETVPVLKRARTQEEMQEEAAVAFLSTRTYAGKDSIDDFGEAESRPPWDHLKKAKGRELSRKSIPGKFKHFSTGRS